MHKTNMKILLLAGNTLRSRAYAQQLSRIEHIQVHGLFLGFEQHKCLVPSLNFETKRFLLANTYFIPDLREPLQSTFENQGWDFNSMDTSDVNSMAVINEIEDINPELVIFSGYGGQILKEKHFNSHLPYLHMHPGYLPLERGSTTIYYSILNNKKCSVTAFFMTEQIDAGKIIIRKQYSNPSKGINIDYWYDNVIRADCLYEAINILVNKKYSLIQPDNLDVSEEFFIIHPVLKHLALLISENNLSN